MLEMLEASFLSTPIAQNASNSKTDLSEVLVWLCLGAKVLVFTRIPGIFNQTGFTSVAGWGRLLFAYSFVFTGI